MRYLLEQLGRQRRWGGILLGSVFGAGLLEQVAAPHLEIANSKFVIPPALISTGVRPGELVARERRLQVLSGFLTLTGALGLGFYYRRAIWR